MNNSGCTYIKILLNILKYSKSYVPVFVIFCLNVNLSAIPPPPVARFNKNKTSMEKFQDCCRV